MTVSDSMFGSLFDDKVVVVVEDDDCSSLQWCLMPVTVAAVAVVAASIGIHCSSTVAVAVVVDSSS